MSGPASDPTGASDPEANTRREIARALRRARIAIAWERLWPALARLLTVAGLFLAVAWAGAWIALPSILRATGLALFIVLGVAALAPLVRFRWPTREDALRRLDQNAGIAHRPATALTDTLVSEDPVSLALWQAQRTRTLASLKRIRAGLPSPRLALHDPWALRTLVAMLMVATFIAAGDERLERVAAAFDWNGAFGGANVRVDAWINPPPYTSRPPVILTAARDTPSSDTPIAVPVGSVLVTRASGSGLDVSISGGVTETPVTDQVPQGTDERRFTIAGDGTARVRSPSSQPLWTFQAVPDRAPTIALAKDPERQAKGTLSLSY
ncbi:MAG: DUF4175 domain-containing protein, partial [Xanthobacteraceae bacterium]|nr:DUF4175 domain-containing protein [Xanthobacteraceae bacterium]